MKTHTNQSFEDLLSGRAALSKALDDQAPKPQGALSEARQTSLAHGHTWVERSHEPPEHGKLGLLFSSIVGSRAYGLATENSDTDRRGFYIAGADIQFSLDSAPQQLIHDHDQLCYWEAEKMIRLALSANPTVLEMLYSQEVEWTSGWIKDDLDNLIKSKAFLSQRAFQTFAGYADSQFEKMQRRIDRGDTLKWQHAMHLIRLLKIGIALLKTGELTLAVHEDDKEALLSIKRGEYRWDEVKAQKNDLFKQFEAAHETTPLPEKPDTALAEATLIKWRKQCV